VMGANSGPEFFAQGGAVLEQCTSIKTASRREELCLQTKMAGSQVFCADSKQQS
jgi:hypothetical protein